VSFLKILNGTTSKDNSGSFGRAALGEHVVSFVTKLDLLEFSAETKNIVGQTVDGGLEDSSSSFADSSQIIFLNSTSAEDISVGEVLGSKITNWEVRENNLGSRCDNFIKFLINNVPLGIDNLLEIVWVLNSNFSIILFGFKFKLVLKNQDFYVSE